jgi:hypothetical protein
MELSIMVFGIKTISITTFNILSLSIMTFNILALSIITLSITVLSIMTNSIIKLCITILSWATYNAMVQSTQVKNFIGLIPVANLMKNSLVGPLTASY